MDHLVHRLIVQYTLLDRFLFQVIAAFYLVVTFVAVLGLIIAGNFSEMSRLRRDLAIEKNKNGVLLSQIAELNNQVKLEEAKNKNLNENINKL